jgi:succinyl-diaminopimelate desuccinylase
LKGDVALVLDSGPESLYLGASGIMWGKVTVQGKQGHAGYPFKAENAIEKAIKLVAALEPYRRMVEKKQSILPAPQGSPKKFVWGRFTVTMIKAGEKENIIPGTCEFRFDRRLLPEELTEDAEKELHSFFHEAVEKTGCEAKLEITSRQQGYCTSRKLEFSKTISECISKISGRRITFAGELGGNDGSFFAKNQIPVVCFGSLRSYTNYHGIDEFLYLEDIKNVRDIIVCLGKTSRKKIV